MMNAPRFCFVGWALLGVLLSSCSQRPVAEETPQATTPETVVEEVAAAPGSHSTPTSAVDSTVEAEINALSVKLREYVKAHNVIPSDLSELVRAGYISRLPDAPPGKRFGIQLHPLGYSVVLLD